MIFSAQMRGMKQVKKYVVKGLAYGVPAFFSAGLGFGIGYLGKKTKLDHSQKFSENDLKKKLGIGKNKSLPKNWPDALKEKGRLEAENKYLPKLKSFFEKDKFPKDWDVRIASVCKWNNGVRKDLETILDLKKFPEKLEKDTIKELVLKKYILRTEHKKILEERNKKLEEANKLLTKIKEKTFDAKTPEKDVEQK